MALTSDQLKKIDNNRQEERPYYYNSSLDKEFQISSDFEAYLILLENSVKNDIVKYLQKTKLDGNKRKDRDEILAIAIQNELDNANTLYNAYQTELSSFSTFRDSINVEGFEQVAEIGLILDDLQFNIDEDLLALDRSQHLMTLTYLVQQSFTNNKMSDALIKEIDSWIEVINVYQGI